MTKIFSIEKCSFKMVYIVLLTVCTIMSSCGMIFCDLNNFEHPFFSMWVMFFSESLIICVYLFQRYVLEEKKPNSSEYDMLPGKNKIKTILIIVCLSICDFSSSIINELLNTSYIGSHQIIYKALFFGFTIYLCIHMLKYHFYRHHYLGIGIYFIIYYGIL